MLQQIEEACPIGAHAALIVPPTWIIRVRRHQVTQLSVTVIIKLIVIYSITVALLIHIHILYVYVYIRVYITRLYIIVCIIYVFFV